MQEPFNILFMGTPEFALVSLEKLAASRHNLVGVVSSRTNLGDGACTWSPALPKNGDSGE